MGLPGSCERAFSLSCVPPFIAGLRFGRTSVRNCRRRRRFWEWGICTLTFHWREDRSGILYRQIVDQAVRVPDPFLQIAKPWLLRRLAPDCSRIPLASLPKQNDEISLLRVMGMETANIHLGTRGARESILQDLGKRPAKWLHQSTAHMSQALLEDWQSWRA